MRPDFEKRDASRRRLIHEASIRLDGRWVTCQVINLSASGIRVGLSEPMKLDQVVDIRLGDTTSWPATLRWQRRLEAGFEFVD